MAYFLEYLPVLSIITQPSGTRYRYSKVWRLVPESDVNTYVPVSLNRPWPAYLQEGVMVRLLEHRTPGITVLVSAWRLKKAGPGWDIIFDYNKSGFLEIQTSRYV